MISTTLFYTEILSHGITNAECRVNADNVERSCAIHKSEIMNVFSYVFVCSCVSVQSTFYVLRQVFKSKKSSPKGAAERELASYGVSPLEIRVMAVTTDQLRLKDATDTADSHVYLLIADRKVIA